MLRRYTYYHLLFSTGHDEGRHTLVSWFANRQSPWKDRKPRQYETILFCPKTGAWRFVPESTRTGWWWIMAQVISHCHRGNFGKHCSIASKTSEGWCFEKIRASHVTTFELAQRCAELCTRGFPKWDHIATGLLRAGIRSARIRRSGLGLLELSLTSLSFVMGMSQDEEHELNS